MEFLGLVALKDPPRSAVYESIKNCKEAGIDVVVVSGDHALTAKAIAEEVGLEINSVFSGKEIEGMSEKERARVLKLGNFLVARSNPETKLHLVSSLQSLGHTVAMTGDGANDAPALRKADIGIAMGESGTDVAREAATMVLTDDNFASIASAIKEGRVVYENIRKFITYIFAHATPEVVPFLLFALSGGTIPLPITALQILAIDLGTETLPALALGREPAEPGIMKKKPRPKKERIVSAAMLRRAWVYLGIVEAALVVFGFLFVLWTQDWGLGESVPEETYFKATAMTFAGITACQVGTAFAARTTASSLKDIGIFSNKLLIWGILFEIIFASAIIFIPYFQEIFKTASLDIEAILILSTFPFIVWGSDEIRRFLVRRKND